MKREIFNILIRILLTITIVVIVDGTDTVCINIVIVQLCVWFGSHRRRWNMCDLLIPYRGVDQRQQRMPLKSRPRVKSVFWKSGRPFVRIRCDAVAAVAIRMIECNWSRCYHHGGGLLRLSRRVLLKNYTTEIKSSQTL